MKTNIVQFPLHAQRFPITNSETIFPLILVGNALNEKGIFNGDVAVVKQNVKVFDGDLAFVRTPFGDAVKFVRFDNRKILLDAANKRHEQLIFDVAEIEIIGRICSITRNL